MVVKELSLKNYRNYEELDIELSDRINVFYGNNAQGKTNILESLYVCSTTKSHRGAKDKELIRFGEEEAHIRTTVAKRGIDHRIDMHLKKNRAKGVAIDGNVIKKASELLDFSNIVIFSPEDLAMIKRGPSERRKFIDMQLCQLDRVYLNDLFNYGKAVDQRNALLKNMYYGSNTDTLDEWDEMLINYGLKIIRTRRNFISRMNKEIKTIHEKLSNGLEEIELIYEPETDDKDLRDELRRKRETDIRFKTTSVGPHRDDIRVNLSGIDARRFGSQGQQRTSALSMKLAGIEIIKKEKNDAPVLLLDDVLSELDSYRKSCLFENIKNIQTLITCTDIEDFKKSIVNINRIFKVSEGKILEG